MNGGSRRRSTQGRVQYAVSRQRSPQGGRSRSPQGAVPSPRLRRRSSRSRSQRPSCTGPFILSFDLFPLSFMLMAYSNGQTFGGFTSVLQYERNDGAPTGPSWPTRTVSPATRRPRTAGISTSLRARTCRSTGSVWPPGRKPRRASPGGASQRSATRSAPPSKSNRTKMTAMRTAPGAVLHRSEINVESQASQARPSRTEGTTT